MTSILEKLSVRRVALPISVEQYHRLGREGIIGQRTELLRGVIIERMTKSPLDTYVVHVIVKWLQENIEADQHLRKEEPLTFADSEPEPDIAVVAGQPDAYRCSTHLQSHYKSRGKTLPRPGTPGRGAG